MDDPSFLQSLSKEQRDSLLRVYGSQRARLGRGAGQGKKGGQATGLASIQDFARLSVRAERVAQDNTTLRSALEQLGQQNKALESQIQALESDSHRQQQATQEGAAFRIASLENQVEYQKTALRDLARTAKALARENVALGAQVERLQDDQEDCSRARTAMQERLSHLQSTFLALSAPCSGGPSSAGSGSALDPSHGAPGGLLLRHITASLAVLSPEVSAQLLEPSRARAMAEGLPTDLRLALRELAGAGRERDALRAKVKQLSAQLEKLQGERKELQQSRAAERRAASAAAAQLQSQLETTKRRVEHLAGQVEAKNGLLAERDAYICKLEQTLVAHRRQPQTAAAATGAAAGRTGISREAPDFAAQLATIAPPSKVKAAAAAPQPLGRRQGSAQGTAQGGLRSQFSPADSPIAEEEDWVSYRIGSPGSTASMGTKRGTPSLRLRPCSAPSGSGNSWGGRPRSVRGRGPGEGMGDPVALKLAAVLEALELEQQGEGLLAAAGRASGWQRQAAPNNPLFSLSPDLTGAGLASPACHSTYQFAGAARLEGAGEGSPDGWAAGISSGNLTASLTFLHQNSLFQRSPPRVACKSSLDEGSQGIRAGFSPALSASPAGPASPGGSKQSRDGSREAGQGSGGQLIRKYRVLAAQQGAAAAAGRQGTSGLLAQSDDDEPAWAPAQPSAAAGACNDERVVHAKGAIAWGLAGARAAKPSVLPARRAQQQQPTNRSLARPSTMAPPARPAPGKPAPAVVPRTKGCAAATSSASIGARGPPAAERIPADASLGCDPLKELPELPEDGFGSVADLLEALTPKSAAAAAAEAALLGSSPAPRDGGDAWVAAEDRAAQAVGQQKQQGQGQGAEQRQAGNAAQPNRHTLRRVGSQT